MATQLTGIFNEYKLSEAETLAAYDLPLLTIQLLHNLRTEAAMKRLNLVFDTNHPHEFIQQEACLKGQIGLIDYILDCVEATQQQKLNQQN